MVSGVLGDALGGRMVDFPDPATLHCIVGYCLAMASLESSTIDNDCCGTTLSVVEDVVGVERAATEHNILHSVARVPALPHSGLISECARIDNQKPTQVSTQKTTETVYDKMGTGRNMRIGSYQSRIFQRQLVTTQMPTPQE